MTVSRTLPVRAPLSSSPSGGADLDTRRAFVLALPLLAWQLLLWTVVGQIAYRAPQVDSAEQFVWSISLENGYWKHPPLPSWLMHALVQCFGASVNLPLVATQAAVAITLLLLLRLGCAMMPPARALLAVALTSLVTYFNIGADSFNHSTVLLPFLAALLLSVHAAVRRGGLHRWALAGLCAGLAMLVKYLALLQVAALLVYLVLDRREHHRRTLAGLAVAALVAGLTLLPHLLWLQAHDFLPLHYARSVARSSAGLVATLRSLADFVLMQLLRLLPFLLGAAWLLRRPAGAPPGAAADAGVQASDRLFLWTAGVLPLLLELGYALATRTELQSRWGSTGFLLIGLLLLAHRRGLPAARPLPRALAIVAVLQTLLCLGSALGQTVLAERLHRPTRANFPGAALAQQALQTWGEHAGTPLRLVVSDIWLGGNLIANSPQQRIAVLIDGRHFMSPWVREQAIDDCGALVLDDLTTDDAGHARANPVLDALFARADATGLWTLPWADTRSAGDGEPRGRVRWAVLRPRSGHRCTPADPAP